MKHFYSLIFVGLLGTFFFSTSAFSAEPKSDGLQYLIQTAIANNPQVKSAFEQWQASQYKIKEARGLPDPMATYGYFGESVQTRVGPQKQKFGFVQKIPFPGKLSMKGHAQEEQAKIMEQKYEAAKRELIKNVKFSYYDLYWVDQALQVTQEEMGLLENLEEVARKRYEVNQASQQDVIKAQVELTKLTDKLTRLKQERDSLAARLNNFLNRPKEVPIDTIQNIQHHEVPYSLDELIALSEGSRQELLGAQLAQEKASYEKSLARLDYFPDFTFGVEYIDIASGTTTSPDDGEDAWMGMVSVNIPIWFDQLNANLKEKRANLKASENNLENLKNTVIYEVQDVKFKIDAYKDVLKLYETSLIPQTQQAFEAAKLGYESGKVDFFNWLDAERTILQTRLAYYQALANYEKSIAYLERIVGKDL